MRQLTDWIQAFVEYTEGRHSPEIFRQWAAVSAISAGLQRRCFVRIMGSQLYPNLFILLVADPGVGKSMAIFSAREVIREDSRIKLAPQRITKEAFYEELESAQFNTVLPDQPVVSYHALSAMIDEFGVFVRRGDLDFMADLADLYDCRDPFEYKTKHHGKQHLRRPWFNFISGCTPAWVKESFTEVALEQGFPARIIAVYSDKRQTPNLWTSEEEFNSNNKLLQVLREDFAQILSMSGEFVWSLDAASGFQDWIDQGMRPFPMDPRLKHYNTRRVVHVAKISCILSASHSDSMEVTFEDFKNAQKLLLDTELHMHEAYANVGKNPYFVAVETILKYSIIEYRRTKRPIAEHTLVRVLSREVPYNLVYQILDQLVASNRLQVSEVSQKKFFTPTGEDYGD